MTLFIDTHDAIIKMGLFKENKKVAFIEKNETQVHSTLCMPTLIELLEENNFTVDDLSDVVVVVGPGSFTGVRLGVTIAKTLSFVKKLPIREVTSLECVLKSNLKTDYLSQKEKNGYFVGTLDTSKKNIKDYTYYNKKEYEEFIENHEVLETYERDYEELMAYVHQKKPINPHKVNPFYVKKIEVLK